MLGQRAKVLVDFILRCRTLPSFVGYNVFVSERSAPPTRANAPQRKVMAMVDVTL